MQSLNIVNLIESNPIAKLTNVYNNKFLTKIQENFSEMEQQMFVSSCYCYLNYNQTTDFVIDLDDVWKWLGFSFKQKATVLLEKHFTIDMDYKCLLTPEGKQKTDGRGGHNKVTIMLTVKTFKLFCIKADTKKTQEIHEYFIKLEEILQQIIQEESNELKLQLENVKNEMIKIEESNKNEMMKIEETNKTEINKKVSKEREQFLLREFGTIGSIIYIIKVKSLENGQYVVKIGESRRGIQGRYSEHKTNFEEILLLDCFSVKRCKDFESFIFNHELVKFNRVTDLPGHEQERELFLIGKSLSYKTLLQLINGNIKQFNDYDLEKLQTENEMLKNLMISYSNENAPKNENVIIQELLNGQKEMIKMIQNLEKNVQRLEKNNKEILDKINSSQTKTTTNFNQPLVTVGPRLQQINPENMTLNKVYESVAECLKEYHFKVKRPSIIKAIDENTIYYGYRWAFVDRNVDPNIIVNIAPTIPTRPQNIGYIAKLNPDKTKIINVYLDRKTAATNNNYASHSALDTPVKNGTITNGYYYILFDKCSDELQNAFIQTHGEPILYKDGVGQFTHENELMTEFVCKYDCIKQLKMSDKTLTKSLDKNVLYNNCYFKSIGSKLQM